MDGASQTHAALSVVIPCFNEAESLEALHAELTGALDAEALSAAFGDEAATAEIIFVDDGSTDGTREVLHRIHGTDSRVEVVQLRRNSGKAAALAAGFAHARGRVLCTLDADLQDDPAELPPLVAEVATGRLDLIVGWKRARQDPWTKVLPSRVFNWMLRRLVPVRLHDVNCGLKVLCREVAEAAPLYGDLYRFLPAFAAAQGFSVDERPVRHRPRAHGKSKYGAGRFLRGFLDLFTVLLLTRYRYRPLHLFGGIGAALLGLGLTAMGYLSVRWFQGEAIGHRPLLLLGVLLFLTGLQGIATGLLAEMLGHVGQGVAALGARPALRVWSHRPISDSGQHVAPRVMASQETGKA